MIQVLIVCKNDSTAKKLLNNVISKISDLRLIGIANTLPEGIYFLKNHEPNLIFTTSYKFLEYLNEHDNYYTPGVILLAKPDPEQIVEYKQKTLLLHIDSQENYRIILGQALKFISKNYTTSKKEELKEILLNIGFDFKHSGTNFLLDCIIHITTYKGAQYFENLSTDIYPFVAKKNNTTPKIVKWAIERSILYMYQKHGKEAYDTIENYFGIKYPKKITPKVLIHSIIELIQEDY